MPVPRLEALACAHLSRTSKLAEASRRICHTPVPDAHASDSDRIYISTKTSTVCCILDVAFEIFQISVCQERASSKRFSLCNGLRIASRCLPYPPATPRPGLPQDGRHRKNNKFLFNCQIIRRGGSVVFLAVGETVGESTL